HDGGRWVAALGGAPGARHEPAATRPGVGSRLRRRGPHAPGCFGVIAGGGPAGHVQPAIAIARALAARGHPVASIELVGSERGIETRLVPARGCALPPLPGRGFERRLSLRNLRSAGSLLVACGKAWRLLGRRRPRVVLSVGGYASV